MDIFIYYGLFLAKTLTILLAVAMVFMMIASFIPQRRDRGEEYSLKITKLNDHYRELKEELVAASLSEPEKKLWFKTQKKEEKQEAKALKQKAKHATPDDEVKKILYVLDFKGNIEAAEVMSLREEISAILSVANEKDEVLLRLESPGGVVHGYGLAASQLQRLRQKGIRLTVAVDKVAASGGYMMACVADKIIAAPFAILGSVGVVAQLPNFNRLLKRHDVDMELHTAGEYKRTLTVFGENTDQGRAKFREELNETHELFKSFIHENRPALDVDKIATGEHWFGTLALQKGLIDEINTSDDVIVNALPNCEVIQLKYERRRTRMERLTQRIGSNVEQKILKWWQNGNHPFC